MGAGGRAGTRVEARAWRHMRGQGGRQHTHVCTTAHSCRPCCHRPMLFLRFPSAAPTVTPAPTCGMSLNAGRASPKSQILSLQSELARMFLGFRSRWNTCGRHRQQAGTGWRAEIAAEEPRACACARHAGMAACCASSLPRRRLRPLHRPQARPAPAPEPAHLCRVDVLEAAQHLVQEELVVLRGQVVVGLDDLAERGGRRAEERRHWLVSPAEGGGGSGTRAASPRCYIWCTTS